MKLHNFDITVIGGGPAGSSAAMLLSKKGYSVALIEKKVFPREVLCGEFLSGEVIDFLDEYNLFNDFLKLDPNPVTSFRFTGSNSQEISSDIGFPAYALKRSKFDQFLLLKAEYEGAVIFQPAEVTMISEYQNRYSVLLKSHELPDFQISTKVIIAAYGKQNILDRKLKRLFSQSISKFNGFKIHINKECFNNLSHNEIRIFNGKDIYCGINAVSADTVTVCSLYDRGKLKYSTKELLHLLSVENHRFGSILKENFYSHLDSIPVYGTGNIYFGPKELTDKGIFYIGDAAGVIAPLAGDGIGMAVQSAQLLSGILCKHNLGIVHSSEEYNREWKKQFSGRLRTAGSIQNLIKNKLLNILG